VWEDQILSCIHGRVVNTLLVVGTTSSKRKKFGKASGITALPRAYLSLRVLYLADDLAGIATGELIGVSQLNKEAEQKRFRT
jgi:hypothetical protein